MTGRRAPMFTYRRTTIGLVAVAAVFWAAYFITLVYAEDTDAPHLPFYGGLAFIALGLSVWAGFRAYEDRRPVATPAVTSPADGPAELAEDIDNAPTGPILTENISVRVPRPRSQVYQRVPDPPAVVPVRAEPMTVEMRPAGYVQMVPVKAVDELIAEVREDLQEARKAAHDRVWLEAVGEVSDTVLQLNDGAPEPPAGSPPVAGQGVDPEAIEMMRRLDRRLRGE